jgi:hypothetical protein
MRTTIAIDDHLLEAAKKIASTRGQTLGQYVEQSLRASLVRTEPTPTQPVIPVFNGGSGIRAGIDPRSNRELYDAMDASGDLT